MSIVPEPYKRRSPFVTIQQVRVSAGTHNNLVVDVAISNEIAGLPSKQLEFGNLVLFSEDRTEIDRFVRHPELLAESIKKDPYGRAKKYYALA